MIQVYFEGKGYADEVATFETSELYNACLPILEAEAKKNHFDKVTEAEVD